MKSLRAHEAVNCGVGAFFTLHAAFHAAIDYCAFWEDFSCVSKNRRHQLIFTTRRRRRRSLRVTNSCVHWLQPTDQSDAAVFGGCTPPAHDPSPTHLNISERSNPPAAAPIHLNISAGRRTKSKAKPQPAAREFEKLFFFFFFNERCCPFYILIMQIFLFLIISQFVGTISLKNLDFFFNFEKLN